MNYRDLIQFDTGAEIVRQDNAAPEPTLLLAARLVQKTPAQATQVREHLSKFTKFYGGMSGRLDEFVALFPVHPDSIAALEKISFVKPADILRWLSDEVKKMLDESVPTDSLGLIGYDRFWEYLRQHPGFQTVSDEEAVVYCSKTVTAAFEKYWTRTEWKPTARQILHALLVHRLTTGDIYNLHGATPAELRDALCLPPPAMGNSGGEPAEALRSLVVEILGELRKVVGETSIFFHPHTHQFGIHIQKFKRFVKPEIALHWVNGLPFLVLMLTGAVMLASRFWHIDRGMFVIIHEVFSAAWVIGLPLTVLVHARIHWQHLRIMLAWGRDDLLWMTQSFRSVYNKNITPPPAGRFNTGQKINALLVFVYFFGFSATGLLMFFKGSILFPWYVHTALFFSAMGTVGGHLHLALLNPSTRIALAGIFNGWAPIEYIRHHHPLSLPSSAQSHHPHPGKKTLKEELLISRVEIIILIVTFLLAGVGALAFNKSQLASVKSRFAKKFADSISPNDLSTRHRLGPLAESCTKCHSYTGQIPDANCEQCHVDIKDRRLKLAGYHGTFKGDCRICHREHLGGTNSIIPPFQKKFNHDLTLYKLEGKHTKLECDECHKKLHPPVEMDKPITSGIYFIGLKSDKCTDCHRDPHTGQFAVACEKCHSANAWTGKELKFSHDTDSSYPLLGRHASVECAKCHKPNPTGAAPGTAQFKGLSHDCIACHEDPHRKQFVQQCTACHSLAGWKKELLSFNHDRDSKFPLVAKHADAACEKCHTPSAPGERLAASQMHGLKSGCTDCHKDPHRAQFKADCVKCHPQPDSWKGKQLHFDHNRDSKFALLGKHATVECVKCHKPQPAGAALASAQFTGLAIGCETCHPVKHPPEYGPICQSCHTINNWIKKKPAADHISRNEVNDELLLGKHITARCDACHNAEKIPALGYLSPARYDCLTCHTKDDPHKGTLGKICYQCHVTDSWKGEGLRFNHDTMTRWPLDQDHRKVACAKCHENNHWKPINSACASCHPKFTEEKNGVKQNGIIK